jgi:hypothetical protein
MATVIKKGSSTSEISKTIRKAVKKNSTKGILQLAGTMKSDIDPKEYQTRLRDEWK